MKLAWERHGEGAPLLLIHGLGYARWGWEPVLDGLAGSFDVILFDNRGIGESDAPPGPYTTAQLAADALQVLDEAGVERAHVLGTFFILLVFFVPGGLASLPARVRGLRSRREPLPEKAAV